MAFGGGGTADYEARFVIDTRQAERQLQVMSGKLRSALGVVGRNFNANIGQSLREVGRVMNDVSADASGLVASASNLTASQAKAAAGVLRSARALRTQTTALRDLRAQNKATTADYLKLARALDRLAVSYDNSPLNKKLRTSRADALRTLAADIRTRAAENPKTIPTLQPLSAAHIANAELQDANKRELQLWKERNGINKLWVQEIAGKFDAEQRYWDGIQKQRQERLAQINALNASAKAANAQYLAATQSSNSKERADRAAYISWWEKQLNAQDRLIAREEAQNKRRQEAALRSLASMFRGVRTATFQDRSSFSKRLFSSPEPFGIGGRGGGRSGRGGRISGGGHGGWEEDSGDVRGQLMPERSKAAAKALLGLSSAAQGAMLGIAALDGNIVGLGFSLIFLGYGVVSVALAFAALTAASVAATRFFSKIIKDGAKAGAAMEKLGQQMASFFQDQARAQANLSKASGFARAFGLDTDSARQAVFTLDKVGMATTTYMDAVANAAAATNRDVADVAEQFAALTTANVEDRARLMEQFAKDFSLENKRYVSSLELAEAINTRFSNAAKDRAATQIGMVARLKAAWTDFATSVGSVLQGYFKPVLEMAIAFVEAMTTGFQAAKKSGEQTGQLQKNMDDFAATVRKLTPYMVRLGYVIGVVVYHAIRIAAKIVKILSDALIRLWNKIKPIIDTIRAWIPKIKELIDNLVSWYQKHETLINIIGGTILALLALELGTRIFMGVVKDTIGFVHGLMEALRALANLNIVKIIKFFAEGLADIFKAVDDLIAKLASIGNKVIGFAANGLTDLIDGVGRAKDKLDELKDKTIKVTIDQPGGAQQPGGGFNLPTWNITGGIIQGLAQLSDEILRVVVFSLRFAAAHPMVALAAAAIGAAIVVAIFPRESGIVAKEATDWLSAGLVAMLFLIPRMSLRFAGAIIDLFKTALEQAWNVISTFVEGIWTAFANLFANVFGGFKDIIVGLFTLDFAQAWDGAKRVVQGLFIQFPKDIFGAFFDTAKTFVTESIPALVESLVSGMRSVFEPIAELIKEPFEAAWDFINNRAELFKAGWVSRKMDTLKETFTEQLRAIREDFKNAFGFDIVETVKGAFDHIANWLGRIPNPFGRVLDWLDDIISKSRRVTDALNAIVPGNPFGGGGSSNSGGGGTSNSREWVPARVTSTALLVDGKTRQFQIEKSHWSNEPAQTIWVQTSDGSYPNLANYALGGRVPGRPGTKVPVLAEAGEVFLGHPTLARGSGREQVAAAQADRGVNIYLDARGSVMTNDVMQRIADAVAGALAGNLSGNRRMTFHHV